MWFFPRPNTGWRVNSFFVNLQVVLRAVPPGYGMKGGRIARAILKQFGIADCTAKAVGRRKPFSVVRAIFKALARHESLSTIARTRGRRIIEMEWRRGAQNWKSPVAGRAWLSYVLYGRFPRPMFGFISFTDCRIFPCMVSHNRSHFSITFV